MADRTLSCRPLPAKHAHIIDGASLSVISNLAEYGHDLCLGSASTGRIQPNLAEFGQDWLGIGPFLRDLGRIWPNSAKIRKSLGDIDRT